MTERAKRTPDGDIATDGSDSPALPPAVLHCILPDDGLLLWAEADLGLGASSDPDGLTPRAWGATSNIHPSALSHGDLLARVLTAAFLPVAKTGPRPTLNNARHTYAQCALPSAFGLPLPSPALGGDPRRSARIQKWYVPVLQIPLAQAEGWLRPFHVSGTLGLAHEWAFVWRAAGLVRAMVGRGAFAPGMAWDFRQNRLPVWQPVFGSADRTAWARLREAFPLAVWPSEAGSEDAAGSFAYAYTDLLVRSAVRGCRPLAPYRRRARGETDAVRVWLGALLVARRRRMPSGLGTRGNLRTWLADPVGLHGLAALALQVGEPAPDAPDHWPVRILLEHPADPGVLRTPSEVRESVGFQDFIGLRRWEDALTQAAEVLPALAAGGDQVDLSTDAVWRLLTTPQARLRAAGIRLLLPAWWKPVPVRTQLRLRSSGRGLFSADALVGYEWRVTLGERTISTEEFERLVAQRTPLVRLEGRWVSLPPQAAAAALRRWRSQGAQGEISAGAALLLALQAEAATPDAEAEEILDVEADEALLATLRHLTAASPDLPEPTGFCGALRPYQRQGLAWLAARADLGLGGVLADDMGLGKTIQILALFAHRRAEAGKSTGSGSTGSTLIVAPTSVVANWAAEAARFTPGLRVVTHHGTDRARGADVAEMAAGADIVLTNYALLLRDAEQLTGIGWDGVILDEAQAIKNPGAKQTQAARRLQARYRFALTGTPVENALADLWSIFTFVQPGYLGSETAFRQRLAGPIEGNEPAGEQARETLRRLIGPLVLRRTKAERGVAEELPPRIETVERCLLTPEQAALYEAVARELLVRVGESEGMRRKAAVLLALLRLKQVCNHPAHYAGDGSALAERSGKLIRLLELLEEVVADGERSLVFTQFASFGRRLSGYLSEHLGPGVPVLCLDGGTPAAERAGLVARFQEAAGAAVFVLSLKAGGAGLNLPAARHVFHYDRWWNPAVERQATDRAHRIGQTGTVHVHKMVCTGTLEERIDELIREKEALAAGVLDAGGHTGERWLTELDDAALRQVLALRKEALE